MLGRWFRRLLVLGVVLALLWIGGLAVLGELGGRWAATRLRSTLATALDADVRVGGVDLALVRGRATLVELHLDRRSLGALRVDVRRAELQVPPLGLALWRRDRAEHLAVAGAELELSSWAVLAPAPAGLLEFPVDSFELKDVKVALAPSLLVPGLGGAKLIIDRARGGATTFRSPVSWLLSIDELDAHVDLPAGATALLRYRATPEARPDELRGVLTLRSSLLRRELAISLALPKVIDGDELAALRELGAVVVREISKHKVSELLRLLVR
ncbi:MAG: hypothetical protein R3B48_11535 [Kofleriaceae bacterium]